MPRIRSIKPEFFTSLTIGGLDPHARLTFIGLWTYADDDGRAIDDVRLIRAAIWPLDDRTLAEVEKDVDLLEKSGLLVRYSDGTHNYLAISNWAEHQRVSHPRASRYPAPGSCNGLKHKELHGHHEGSGEIPEDSGAPPPHARAHAPDEQGAGSREQGKETEEDPDGSLSGSEKPNADVREIFDYWRSVSGHAKATLTPERRKKIRVRLKRYSVVDLKRAIDGACRNPFFAGDNESGQRYDWPETIFRSDSVVEKHMAYSPGVTNGNGNGAYDPLANIPPEMLRRV